MTDFAARRLRMVDCQIRPADITGFPVIEAFLAIPREAFVPAACREMAYADMNLPLAPGRVLLEPRTLGRMVEELQIGPQDLVLDVGSGPGYPAALIGRLAEAVVALEEDADMAAQAEAALAASADNVAVIVGPLTAGAPKHGPYDAIVIEGGVEQLPPALADQLKDGGRIACLFLEDGVGVVRIGRKSGGAISWRYGFNANAPVLPGFARAPEFAL